MPKKRVTFLIRKARKLFLAVSIIGKKFTKSKECDTVTGTTSAMLQGGRTWLGMSKRREAMWHILRDYTLHTDAEASCFRLQRLKQLPMLLTNDWIPLTAEGVLQWSSPESCAKIVMKINP